MPRPRNSAAHVAGAVNQLLQAVTGLVDSLATAVKDGRQVGRAVKGVGKTAGDTGTRIGSAVKAAWARMTPAERKARIAKMHAWRKKGRAGAKRGAAPRKGKRAAKPVAAAGFDVSGS